VVQEAWQHGRALNVYGVIYGVKDGIVKRLVGPIGG
jgi:carbonic anhydrase